MLENSVVEILWDFNIYTDHSIYARRTDIVVDKNVYIVSLIDISIPADPTVVIEKIDKYRDLQIELKCLWNMKKLIYHL